ncbi:MAG TPA: hypothetical protein VFU12_06615 [Glycomyces sp.]|nr:hypothetical protein [Glycomyces sp.]
MNDFELGYMHYARSRELIAEAERERRAKAAGGRVRSEVREGLASRLAKALRRKKSAPGGGTARRLQSAK